MQPPWPLAGWYWPALQSAQPAHAGQSADAAVQVAKLALPAAHGVQSLSSVLPSALSPPSQRMQSVCASLAVAPE
jgi:hypothetical protein